MRNDNIGWPISLQRCQDLGDEQRVGAEFFHSLPTTQARREMLTRRRVIRFVDEATQRTDRRAPSTTPFHCATPSVFWTSAS